MISVIILTLYQKCDLGWECSSVVPSPLNTHNLLNKKGKGCGGAKAEMTLFRHSPSPHELDRKCSSLRCLKSAFVREHFKTKGARGREAAGRVPCFFGPDGRSPCGGNLSQFNSGSSSWNVIFLSSTVLGVFISTKETQCSK